MIYHRAEEIEYNQKKIDTLSTDEHVLSYAAVVPSMIRNARQTIARVLNRPSISEWPLRAFIERDDTRTTFALLTADEYLISLSLYPASDQFNKTYVRIRESQFAHAVAFEHCDLQNNVVLLKAPYQPRQYRPLPTQSIAAPERPRGLRVYDFLVRR